MAKCNINNCLLDALENDDKCILHVKKDEWISKNLFTKENIDLFYQELRIHLSELILKSSHESSFTKDVYTDYLNGSLRHNVDLVKSLVKRKEVTIEEISFPLRNNNNITDFRKLLERLGGLRFYKCDFHCSTLELTEPQVFFQECNFKDEWHLFNYKGLKNPNNVLYQSCFFNKICGINLTELIENVFSDCDVESIYFEYVHFEGLLFNNSPDYRPSIKTVDIISCTFNTKFILNNSVIESFHIKDSTFNEKFEFKNRDIETFRILNTNFYKTVDYYKTSFSKFIIEQSIFDDFVGFENCTYGNAENKKNKDYVAKFIYVTFLDFVNFRNAKFLCGLDIIHINLKEPPNFLNMYISSINTPRETFRIIKYSFDRIGNYIEANKYYEEEMRKHKEELKTNKRWTESFLLDMYELSSNYGQSYVKPIFLIFMTAVLYGCLIRLYKNNLFNWIYVPYLDIVKDIGSLLNGIAKNMLPFKNVLQEGIEFISLLFYIIFTSLIWLTILAIRRKTKR